MPQIDSSRRGFLKSAVAASAAMMSAAAVQAGVPAKSVTKYDETYDVVIIGSGFAGMACALKAGRAHGPCRSSPETRCRFIRNAVN